MKALVYTGPKQLAYREEADPVPGDGEVLVKVEAVGICGSDMHAYLGHDERRPGPLILGHEASGTVIGGPMDGKRVTVNPLKTDADCKYVKQGRQNLSPTRAILSILPREGAFAEYISSPASLLVEMPDQVSFEDASLVEPLACGWHAVRLAKRIADIETANCLVIGGGAIGVASALSLRAQGAKRLAIAETNTLRHAALKALGDFHVFDPSSDSHAGDADIVIDAVGYEQTRAFACAQVATGGVIAHIGLGSAAGGVDVRRLTLQEITFIGCYTYNEQDFRDTAAALFNGRMGEITWTATRSLADGHQAFEDILAGKVAEPKIILHP